MFYHASKTPGINILTPHISNHGKPLIYFSTKRQNTLVYLSNAVEKHCKQVGFSHSGIYKKWASYGFTEEGLLRIDEYYPNATIDTYQGEQGYIYSVKNIENAISQNDIPDAVISKNDSLVFNCEYIPDVYDEILKAVRNGEIILQKYSENNQDKLDWIAKTIRTEYRKAESNPEYRVFLLAKFNHILKNI